VFFGLVVVLTMLAAMSFDPRLIWDDLERHE
jgi:paraquat-inducible protein A